LPEVEAPDGAVARGQGGRAGLHAVLATLATLFGMADQRLKARSAFDQLRVGLRGGVSSTADLQPGLLKAACLEPFQRLFNFRRYPPGMPGIEAR
jgi:hypothetical protein